MPEHWHLGIDFFREITVSSNLLFIFETEPGEAISLFLYAVEIVKADPRSDLISFMYQFTAKWDGDVTIFT